MEILKQPAAISFTGNPILFSIKADDASPIIVKVSISRHSNNIRVYPHIIGYDFELTLYPIKHTRKGAGGLVLTTYTADFDLSDVLDSCTIPLYRFKSFAPSINIASNGEVRYSIHFPDFPAIDIPLKTAIPGGVSDAVFIQFMSEGTDIFTTRFCSLANLFLFSNRGSNKVSVSYYESELCDVWFYRLSGKQYKLVTTSGIEFPIINNPSPPATIETQFFDSVDLAAAYAQLAPADGVMYMSVDDEAAFIINVYPDPIKEEKYILEFRNSFGFMERMLLSGKLKYEPEIKDGEEYVISESNVLRKKKQRGSFTQAYKGDIGYKRMTDMLFLHDLLMSDEVRIFNPISEEYLECSVSAEISISMMQTIPESIPIQIKVMNTERYISLDYNYRIFDKTFSEQFN